jgi:hypothetical protein
MSLSEDLDMNAGGKSLPGEIMHCYEPMRPSEMVITLQELNSLVKRLASQGFEDHQIIDEVKKALNK